MILALNTPEAEEMANETVGQTSTAIDDVAHKESQGGGSDPQEPKRHKAQRSVLWSWAAIIITILAWACMALAELPALILGLVGIIASIVGIGSRHRDTAITALIASSVLVLVIVGFEFLLWFLLK